ncbi:MAG: ATP-dependent Clp protease proteolytic subunit [Oligoflexia bacterium]|nr:ATP-dependent Clp protease proteolytic subunit [Oligoflexia bacterium]
MPSWNTILKEIQTEPKTDPFLNVRQRYINQLFKRRGGNVIAYYSGWLQKSNIRGVEINDNDKNFFMAVIHGLERNKGLDLILHTPGGEVAATESLIDYLTTMFNFDIEVFVPQIAMSAGTMIACASKQIHMGKQSNLGPIDPQIGGLPAGAILDEFEQAAKEIKKQPEKIPLWQVIVSKYHPSLILSCENAIEWSKDIVKRYLKAVMFSDASEEYISEIVDNLSDHNQMKAHSKHIGLKEAQKIGLKINPLESDNELQDIVLTIHHTYMHTLNSTPAIKIVENHIGVGQIQSLQQQQFTNKFNS